MAKHDELIVERRDDGRWGVKKPHAERSSAVENTQRKAIERARELAPEGDIKVRGLDGKFRRIDQRVTRPKNAAAERRMVRARVRGNSLDLLDPIALREGEEVLVTISEPVGTTTDSNALRRAAGAWRGIVDTDALITNIYADRLIATRPLPRV